jgi:hypothetical protein
MAVREIIPFEFDLNKNPNALALSVIPPWDMALVSSNQSYFAQAIHRPVIAPPLPRLLLKDKPRQPNMLPMIKVPKMINIIPSRVNKTLTGVKPNKFGDVTCVKYKSVTPCLSIDGVCTALEQVKVVLPKEKKSRVPPSIQRMMRSISDQP